MHEKNLDMRYLLEDGIYYNLATHNLVVFNNTVSSH